MIDYDDSTHTYSYRGRRYLSATQLIEWFSHEFKSEEQAEQFAYRHGQTKEHWLKEWDETRKKALDRGNQLHNLREDIVRNRAFDVIGGVPFRVRNIEQYPQAKLIQLPDGVYPEMKLWRHDFGIAGRSDKIIFHTIPVTGPRVAHIQDYKTNRFIRMRSWLDSHGNRLMMKVPLIHLEDCDWNHYQLQLSLYQYMLEYHDFHPGLRTIIHFPRTLGESPPGAIDPPPKHYSCKYLRDEVISLLNYLKHRRVL